MPKESQGTPRSLGFGGGQGDIGLGEWGDMKGDYIGLEIISILDSFFFDRH
jgi:hypothetical protein